MVRQWSAVAFASALAVGCGGDDEVTGNTVAIGAVIDQTGSIARAEWREAAFLAVEHANEALDQAGGERQDHVAHQVVRLALLVDRHRPAGGRVRALAQRPVHLGDPDSRAGAAGSLGDGAQQHHFAHRVEARLRVFGCAAAIDVEQRRDGIEAVTAGEIERRRGLLVLEVDHRRADELDALISGESPFEALPSIAPDILGPGADALCHRITYL